MAQFVMPSLGADMEEGTLLEWLVHPGDVVRKGDPVAVVDTDKAAVEVEVFSSGVVEELLVEPGTKVAVGTPLALLGEPAAAAGEGHEVTGTAVPPPRAPHVSPLPRHREKAHRAGPPTAPEKAQHAAPEKTQPGGAEGAQPEALERQRVSPYARRLAQERGVDLSGLQGTVRARDLEAAAPTEPTATAPAQPAATAPTEPTATAPTADQRMRDAIAKLMSRSKREIPHYYLRTTIDLQAATTWLRAHNREVPVAERLVPAALLLAATARAAVAVPQLNGYWVEDRLETKDTVHLGVAVSLRSGGMVTPALHDAQSLTVPEVMAGMRGLVERARRGRLRASELTDATLTVTNLGDLGVEEVLGVIYPPQVAVVGFGAVAERPWAVDGMLGVRPLVTATLSADHRATDGYVGARFLAEIDRLLQHPEDL